MKLNVQPAVVAGTGFCMPEILYLTSRHLLSSAESGFQVARRSNEDGDLLLLSILIFSTAWASALPADELTNGNKVNFPLLLRFRFIILILAKVESASEFSYIVRLNLRSFFQIAIVILIFLLSILVGSGREELLRGLSHQS